MDFLAIGDTTLDTFIRLKDAKVDCDANGEHCMLSMRFGDKIPFEFAEVVPAVGNASNAAVAAARLGLSSALVAAVGDDRDGADCLAALEKNGVATNFIAKEAGKHTNSHYVLWFDSDRTILIKHESFNYRLPAEMPVPKAVYLSSIGESGMSIHEPLASWLEARPEVLFAFQPGTFQMAAGTEALARIYRRADVFICNKEEYQRILKSSEEDEKKLMEAMRALGPKVCVLTDGPKGAYALSADGAWKIKEYPDPRPAYERTGAGDAFSSTLVAALSLGKPLSEALCWGPINAMSVVQEVGAQKGLLSREALEKYLAEAPADYVPEAF